MKRIDYSDLSSQAYPRLKDFIQDGEPEPGKKINQTETAETQGISRMSLHKAFECREGIEGSPHHSQRPK